MRESAPDEVWVVWYQNLPGQILGVFESPYDAAQAAIATGEPGRWSITPVEVVLDSSRACGDVV